jgi:RNA polymerase sigma-70 factor, ECF subfamily
MLRAKKQRLEFEKQALPHLDALYGLALRLAHNERDAEDLVQDTMVKSFRFFHQFEQGSNIKAWLFKVMVNLFYNSCRQQRNIKRLHLEAETNSHYDRFLSEATVNGQHAEEVLLNNLAVEEVRRAVEELPEEFRLAVLLCDLHDLSYKEISDVLGCPVGTVMSRLYRGRRLLQHKLFDYALEQGYLQRAPDSPLPVTAEETSGLSDLDAYRAQKGKR